MIKQIKDIDINDWTDYIYDGNIKLYRADSLKQLEALAKKLSNKFGKTVGFTFASFNSYNTPESRNACKVFVLIEDFKVRFGEFQESDNSLHLVPVPLAAEMILKYREKELKELEF